MLEFESILDTPKSGLDPSVWRKNESGSFVLTDSAEYAVKTVVDYVKKVFSIENPSVRIIGSITSNQYSNDSDIDVHITFEGLTDENQEDLNKVLRADFNENYKDMHRHDEYYVGEHPIEVYFQVNPYQDLMSIGCYDFLQKMWLVGPDLKPSDFDPYSEFYSEDMKYVKDVIEDIRSNILECYEIATVILNSQSGKFKEDELAELKIKVKNGVDIFDSAKQCRKVYSSPTSVEDAVRKRDSKKWKIADSAFKLMDKFGYLKILKNFSNIYSHIDKLEADDFAECIINCIKSTINLNETVDESVKNLGKYLILASFLAIPGFLSQDALAQSLSKIDPSELQVYSTSVQTSIQNACKDKKLYGGYVATDIINMVARTIYVEGRSEGSDGRKAICSVIRNRANNDKNNIAAVIKEKSAFSCWNKMTDSDWKNFTYKIPTKGSLSIVGNKDNKLVWNECVSLAIQLFEGRFESTIGNRNSYLNPKKASSSAVESWGKSLDLEIGKHKFGYLKEHDPKYVIPGTTTPKASKKTASSGAQSSYVVKKNDTLSKIAKNNKMSVDDILKKNPQIKNPDKLSVGQKINV